MTLERTFTTSGALHGRVSVPGDKSISHRALIVGALASGTSSIGGLAPGADVASTIACLERLGVSMEREGDSVTVEGNGWKLPASARLDCGNSGTTMRLLMGGIAGREARVEMTGDASLSRRPMDRVAKPLRKMGADITLDGARYPPLIVSGGSLQAIDLELEVPSAQVKSAVILAGLFGAGRTKVFDPFATRDHTERLLAWWGADVTTDGPTTTVSGGEPALPPFRFTVPGDLSSAAYLIVAACLVPGSDVTIEGVGLNAGRTGLLDALAGMGADLRIDVRSEEPEPTGSISVRSADLKALSEEGSLVPRMIDEIPLLALAATQAHGVTRITGADELRLKESDRIATLVKGLQQVGAEVEELPDGIVVNGPTPLKGGHVDAHGDHRMALTFAVAGVIAKGPVTVSGWEATEISYPGFERDLAAVTG